MLKIRASSLNQAYHCPGYPALAASNTIERDDLTDGTVFHEAMAVWIERKIGNEVFDWLRYGERDDMVFFLSHTFFPWYNKRAQKKELPPLGNALYERPLELQIDPDIVLTGHPDAFSPGEWLIDWKYGDGQKYLLKPIDQDYQMLAYAEMIATQSEVSIYRVRVSDLEYDAVTLTTKHLKSGLRLLQEICRDIADNQDKRVLGAHCDHCLYRQFCPEWIAQIDTVRALVSVPEIDPLTHQEALRWALARGAVKERTKQLDAALRAYVSEGNVLELDGKTLKLQGEKKQRIVKPDLAIEMLSRFVGEREAKKAQEVKVSTSKSAIEKVLKAAKKKPKERREVFERIAQAGAITEFETSGTLRWSK